VAAAYPSSFAIEMGLGGSFRQTLINEDFVVGVWPLSELASTRARDITGNNKHGSYAGTGFTRGVTVDLPEGALGLTFDGNGYVEVLDDGGAAAVGQLNLSLEGGSIDIVFLLKTSQNDATNRAIVQKMVTDATGNGWSVSLVSGAIRFRLEVAGSEIFNFDRGAVSDGSWHLVHCYYDPASEDAIIYIDGVQSGATVTGVTTEPEYTAANLRIGCWNDGSGDFIGTLAMVMIGREGNTTLSASLHATRTWTAVTSDVRQAQPIVATYGIQGSSVLDIMARPGTLTFALNNAETNTARRVGYYSPGHTNCRSGFQIGAPVRWSITSGGVTRYHFRGFIKAVTPIPGAYRERLSIVLCADWLDVASSVFTSAVETQTNVNSDDAFKLAIDQSLARVPPAVSIGLGSSTFPYAFDISQGESESILTEMTRVTTSERGFCYPVSDTTQGGTLVWEGRSDRQLHTDLDATFNGTMHGLDVTYNLEALANIIRIVVTPRRVDAAATTVLYALEISEQSVSIAPGQTLALEGGYRNPSQDSVRVGGTAMVEPVANTDYAFWSRSDGSGVNLTSDLSVYTDNGNWLGGSSFRVEITNNGGSLGYLRLNSQVAFQLRGKGIYYKPPVMIERRDRDSVRRHGPRTVQIDLPYESSIALAESVADFLLEVLGSERPMPRSMTVLGNVDASMLATVLALNPGDKIGLIETVSGLVTDDPDTDADVGYFINGKRLTYAAGGIITAEFALAPGVPTIGTWVLDDATLSVLGDTTVLGY